MYAGLDRATACAASGNSHYTCDTLTIFQFPINNFWDDTYVWIWRQTRFMLFRHIQESFERCLLMTTDPGDLVLDPTCGSGTTAYVAEQWGRRWITIDTSRVALALARTRLMAARFPYYLLADSPEGRKKQAELTATIPTPAAPPPQRDMHKGFVYRTVPHVTLKSIANNPDIKEGMTREQIDKAIARHAETETLLRPALRGQEHRAGDRAVHRGEPVAAPQPAEAARCRRVCDG